ncbi:transmembrane protein [Ceratobasidium sp. AG-Ba]|nr:transmembrane protein [Ceratobasidium sp. AG-Ba]
MANLVEVVASDIRLSQYVSIAFVALLFYDHAITFSNEVALIWPAKFGPVKAVFLFNRYVIAPWIAISLCSRYLCDSFESPAQIEFSDIRTCDVPYPLNMQELVGGKHIYGSGHYANDQLYANPSTATTFSEANIQPVIVAIRVYDLWRSQKLVFIFLGPVWVVHCAVDVAIASCFVTRNYAAFDYVTLFNICFGEVEHMWIFWVNGITYHGLIQLALLYVWISTPRTSQTRLMQLVVRDGICYFATIFCAMLFNLLVWIYGRPSQIALPYNCVWCVTLMSLSRMLLSIGSVQTSEEWGQRAKIEVPSSKDFELGGMTLGLKRPISFQCDGDGPTPTLL